MRGLAAFVLALTFAILVLTVDATWSQPPAGKAEETKAIPLGSCYSTPGVNGCKVIAVGSGQPYSHDLEGLRSANWAGASNVVLVQGNDLAGAIKATKLIFAAGHSADTAGHPEANQSTNPEPLPHWLVAYFGSGSSTPLRKVVSVEIGGRTIRVTYAHLRPNQVTQDIARYYLWAPIGRLDAGTYTLELFDAERKEVMLARRVRVDDR